MDRDIKISLYERNLNIFFSYVNLNMNMNIFLDIEINYDRIWKFSDYKVHNIYVNMKLQFFLLFI